jgi:hypothetical protein
MLAETPSFVRPIGEGSQESNSRLAFSEHDGEQTEGVFGWRALFGRGGIAGGGTSAPGDECSGALAQAASSSGSSVAISLGGLDPDFGGIFDLPLLGGASLFLGTVSLGALAGRAICSGDVLGERLAGRSGVRLCGGYAALLDRKERRQRAETGHGDGPARQRSS